MQRRCVGNQPDLFQVNLPAIQRVALERAKLMPLLRSLLLEVVSGANTKRPSKESDHD
jgi:hypothetical protein